MATPTRDEIRRAPKVLLHDHLDGGLRPATVLELADATGHRLPADDAAALGRWFVEAADSGSLERYLETFAHTVAVMQTADALHRVAAECALDLAADGVVHAEVRFAPEQHLTAGLSLEEVVEAVLAGFSDGAAQARAAGQHVRVCALLDAMRHADRSMEIARLAVRYRDAGVAGFDIAGAEAGYPPDRHLDAFEYLRREGMPYTIHAGEAYGLPSIRRAVQWCGAQRVGHGVRLVDDIDPETGKLGRLAGHLLDLRTPLEICPSSNVQTGAAASIGAHPIEVLRRLSFRVTVNTDNRLMSGTSMSQEMWLLVETFGYDWSVLERLTVNAMKSAFVPFGDRRSMINDVILPGYARVAGI